MRVDSNRVSNTIINCIKIIRKFDDFHKRNTWRRTCSPISLASSTDGLHVHVVFKESFFKKVEKHREANTDTIYFSLPKNCLLNQNVQIYKENFFILFFFLPMFIYRILEYWRFADMEWSDPNSLGSRDKGEHGLDGPD
jgi:hypothetical protein